MTKIQSVSAWEVLDSRGYPTVRAEVHLVSGAVGRATSPSGASTGKREAHELRDGDPARFAGRGVLRAVGNVTSVLGPALSGMDAADQARVDQTICEADGTANKERLGANATVAVSLAVAQAAAIEAGRSLFRSLDDSAHTLPVPMLNVLNGGQHARGGVDFQEFMLVPGGAPTFAEAMRWAAEVYHVLSALLADDGLSTGVGDEGGFAPSLAHNEDALRILVRAIEHAGYRPGADIALALDPAASSFFNGQEYDLSREGVLMRSGVLIDRYRGWIRQYPIISIEDGLAEDDWAGWDGLARQVGSEVQLVGDDIFVTNSAIIKEGIARGIANAVLIKPNQIGTLTETREAMGVTHAAHWRTVISHRSGETDDSTIADLAVGLGAHQIKSGAPARGERLAKYNRLIEIERELGSAATYAGWSAFAHRAPAEQDASGRGR